MLSALVWFLRARRALCEARFSRFDSLALFCSGFFQSDSVIHFLSWRRFCLVFGFSFADGSTILRWWCKNYFRSTEDHNAEEQFGDLNWGDSFSICIFFFGIWKDLSSCEIPMKMWCESSGLIYIVDEPYYYHAEGSELIFHIHGGSIFLLLKNIFFPFNPMNAHIFMFQPCLKNYQSVDTLHFVSEGAHCCFFYF